MSAPRKVELVPDPVVSVFNQRAASPGANSLDGFLREPGRYLADEHVPLSEAISRSWDEDAHLVMYAAYDDAGDPAYLRINKRKSTFVGDLMATGGAVRCSVIVLDHDLPKGERAQSEYGRPCECRECRKKMEDGGLPKGTWTEEGLGRFVQFLGQPDLGFSRPTYWYVTQHGSRFLYLLTEPVSHADAEGLMLGVMRDALAAGIELDIACKDFTRFYRLPRVLRDGQRTEEHPLFLSLEFGDLLDPATIVPGEASGLDDSFAAVTNYSGDLPTPDEGHELMWDVSPKTGREVRGKWAKTARQYLTGRDSHAYCFENRVIDEADFFEGKRFAGSNDALVRLIGQITGQLARQEGASPEGIYALLFDAVDQMEPTPKHPDWHAVAWDIICRMYSNEMGQIEAENQEREVSLAEAEEVREDLIAMYRSQSPGAVPDDESEAQAWLRERMIASTGSKHHIMMRDGTYSVCAFGDSMLIPAIRDLAMEDVIETHELRGKVWQQRAPRSILNDHAIPISRVVCSSAEHVASITGDPGYRTLTIPVHGLNPHLVPCYSEDVDTWLRHFFGEQYDRGIEWLAHSLDVRRSICALNLYGASGAGKDMLVAGIAECFRYASATDGNKVFARFNDCILDSPVIHFNEGVPTGNLPGCNTIDQTFRALVSGGDIAVEGKGDRVFNAQVYPRIVFTSNDRDIMRSIIGHRDLSDDDIRAIEIRLLSVEVGPAATRWLTDRGNYRFTAAWIRGDVPSRYVVARHILHLYANRSDPRGSGRLLVEGDVGGIGRMIHRSCELELLLNALHVFLEGGRGLIGATGIVNRLQDQGVAVLCPSSVTENPQRSVVGAGARGSGSVPASGPGLYVTSGALKDLVRAMPEFREAPRSFSLNDLKSIGRKAGFLDDLPGKTTRINGGSPRRYMHVDLAKLSSFWREDGLDCPRTDSLLAMQQRGAL